MAHPFGTDGAALARATACCTRKAGGALCDTASSRLQRTGSRVEPQPGGMLPRVGSERREGPAMKSRKRRHLPELAIARHLLAHAATPSSRHARLAGFTSGISRSVAANPSNCTPASLGSGGVA